MQAAGGTGLPLDWEGLFEIKVYSVTTLKRTISDLDTNTYTYTWAMLLDDFLFLPPAAITFTLRNYMDGPDGEEYSSEEIELIVRKV